MENKFIQISIETKVKFLILIVTVMLFTLPVNSQTLKAGTGKSNITAEDENIHDSLYVKVLILKNSKNSLAIITLDVVSIGTIGYVPDNYFKNIKTKLKKEFGINDVLISATHNHYDGFLVGDQKIKDDLVQPTLKAVKIALKDMEPVKVGGGSGYEDRIAMNRRIKLKDGSVFTIRHANPNAPDDQVSGVGDIDPEIGILRVDRYDGTSKAVLFNYACHPYTGVPGKGVTAEYPGFACSKIEENLNHGSMAFFLQGAAGNITEILYKNVSDYRDSEVFGRMLGKSTLKALKSIKTKKSPEFKIVTKTIDLPLRSDVSNRIKELEEQEVKLLTSLRGTSLNMKSFIPLYIKYSLSPDFPSYYSYRYLQEEKIGLEGLSSLDKENRKNIDKYIKNMLAMDKLSQIEENKAFLKIKQEEIEKNEKTTISVEIEAIRIGNFILVTFPGEPFAEIGMNIKNSSPFENTFLAGYSNGYIHYAPTAEAYKEWGYEVMNCILAPEWQNSYEQEIKQLLKEL